jgi:hypothetical protein
VLTGRVSPEELADVLRDVYQLPNFRPEAEVLCDLRQADLGEFSRAAIKGVAQFVSGHRGAPPGARTAIVVGRDLGFGLARMYEQLVEAESSTDIMVFREMDEALAWLEHPPEELRAEG